MKTGEEYEKSEYAVSVVAATRCGVGTDRAVVAETPGARSFDWGPPPGSRPAGHERHCVRLAHRMSVERVERDRDLQQFHGSSAVSTVAQGRGL